MRKVLGEWFNILDVSIPMGRFWVGFVIGSWLMFVVVALWTLVK